jgi:SlyX protein
LRYIPHRDARPQRQRNRIDPGETEMTDARRVEAIESKLAHLERALQELSDVVYRQQREIDSALELNRQLRRQVESLEDRPADPGAVEIPPHY